MINEKGGITVGGEKYLVNLVIEDGKSTFDGISAAAARLAYDHKVKFVAGPNAFFSSASSTVLEKNKVLHVSSFVTMQPGELDASTPYGFGTDTSLVQCGAAIFSMKKEYPALKKVVIATPDDGAIPYVVPALKKMLALNGFTVVGDTIGYPNEMVDFSPIVAKINATKDADMVYHQNGPPHQMGNIIKGLRASGNMIPYMVASNMDGEDLLTFTGKAGGTDVLGIGLTIAAKENPPLVEEIMKRTGRKTPYNLDSPNALYVLLQMIQIANSLVPAKVKAKWEATEKVDTLFGPGLVCGDQSFGLKHHVVSRPFQTWKLTDGKLVVGPYAPAGVVP
jgi:ABC-type branched-subunit amino acid transport system substrate-binding protein